MSHTNLLDSSIQQAFAMLYVLAIIQKLDWIEEKALIDQFTQLSVPISQAKQLITYLYQEKLLKSLPQKKGFLRYEYLYHISDTGEELLKHYYLKYHLPLSQILQFPLTRTPELK